MANSRSWIYTCITYIFFCCLLTSCDATSVQEAINSDGWTTETKHSPVQGDQYFAQTQIKLDTAPNAFKQITIKCTERTKLLEVEFALFGDQTNDPAFNVTRLGGLELLTGGPIMSGQAVVAGSTNPIDANDIVGLGGFKNVAVLRQPNGSKDMARSISDLLPIAIELESNFGIIGYEIPKTKKIIDTLSKCMLPPQAPQSVQEPATEPEEQPEQNVPGEQTNAAAPINSEEPIQETDTPQGGNTTAPQATMENNSDFPYSAQLVDSRGTIVVQSGASVFSKNVESVASGTHVQASGKDGAWVFIRLESGKVGFVRGKQLQFGSQD